MAPTRTGLTATLAGYPYAGFAEPRLIGIFGARKLLCSGWLIGGDEDPNILGEDADSIHRFFQLSFGASKLLAPIIDFPSLIDVYARGVSWPAFLDIIGHNEFPSCC